MFQLGLAEILQADREREINELVRQRRLLHPEREAQDQDPTIDRRSETRETRVRAEAAGG